jgi:3-deoxy-manno-octulosonate cytidylyltransferase (CMP-KDO synthetase)
VLKDDDFLEVKDFFRIKNNLNNEKIYHHIGIYAFTNIALTKYVKLNRSRLEIERNLEQMRAMENNLIIKVGLSGSLPLGVDTKEDLEKVSKEMN